MMEQLPYVLEPLAEDRRQLFTILDLLDRSDDPVVRADLASELVGTCSRYEDVMARVVYPALERLVGDDEDLAQGGEDRTDVREALAAIRKRTLHRTPSNVHTEDPEGFETMLNDLVALIRAHVEHEDKVLCPVLSALGAEERLPLRNDVEHGVAHASTYPNPPQHLLGRALVAVIERIERGPDDASDTWHPGVELLNEALEHGDTPLPD